MTRLRIVALAASMIAAVAGPSAGAADLSVHAPQSVMPVPEAPAAISGWYLRGDIGYRVHGDPSARLEDSVLGESRFDNNELDDTGSIGLGVGYRFNPVFRVDVTADYALPSDFHGERPCPTCVGSPGFSVETAEVTAFTTLANAYLDFGRWGGFSSYIGAGVGGSFVEVDAIRFVNPDGVSGEWDGDAEWGLAWALMGGFGYEFTPSFGVDVGYRYLDLGDGRSDELPTGSGEQRIEYDDLEAHEVRVGMRYMID